MFGVAAIEAAQAADKGDAETMTLTLKTVAALLVAAVGRVVVRDAGSPERTPHPRTGTKVARLTGDADPEDAG